MLSVAVALLLSVPAMSQEAAPLRYAFEKGQVFRYRTVQEVEFGRSRHVLRDTFRCEVYSLGEEGEARFLVTFEKVAARGEVRHTFDYDSERDKPPFKDFTQRAFSRLVGQKFYMIVHPRGRVTDVTGSDRIRDHLLEGIEDEHEIGLLEQFISFMLKGEILASRMQQIWMPLPPRGAVPATDYETLLRFHLPVRGEMRLVTTSSFAISEAGEVAITHRPRIVPPPGDLGLIPVSDSKGTGKTVLAGPTGPVSSAAMNFSMKFAAGNRQIQVLLGFKAERVSK